MCEIGDLPNEAEERMQVGVSLAAEGRSKEAGRQLERALAFWRSVGATRYVEEGEELLAAAA